MTALSLILDHMLQCKLQLTPDAQNTIAMGGTSLVSESEDTTLAGVGTVDNGKKSCLDVNSKGFNVLACYQKIWNLQWVCRNSNYWQ